MLHEFVSDKLTAITEAGRPPMTTTLLVPYLGREFEQIKLPSLVHEFLHSMIPPHVLSLPGSTIMVQLKYNTPDGLSILGFPHVAKQHSRPNPHASDHCCTSCKQPGNKQFHGSGTNFVATLDSSILNDPQLAEILERGPNYRTGGLGDFIQDSGRTWDKYIIDALKPWAQHMSSVYGLDRTALHAQIEKLATTVNTKVLALHTANSGGILQELEQCEKWMAINPNNTKASMVALPVDKFGDKFALVCRVAYTRSCHGELDNGNYTEQGPDDENEKQVVDRMNAWSIAENLVEFKTDAEGNSIGAPKGVSQIYGSPKFHKDKFGMRFISGGTNVATTIPSTVVSHCARTLIKFLDGVFADMFFQYTGAPAGASTILKSADEVIQHIDTLNRLADKNVINLEGAQVAALDFTKLYPSVTLSDLKKVLRKFIRFCFFRRKLKHVKDKGKEGDVVSLRINQFPDCTEATWHLGPRTTTEGDETLLISEHKLIEYMEVVVDNSYVKFGGRLFKLNRGIPTGTNCAPELTNLYLCFYELTYFHRQLKIWDQLSSQHQLALRSFRRYIDDIWIVGSPEFKQFLYKTPGQDGINPDRFKTANGRWLMDPLEVTGNFGSSCNFLDVTTFMHKGRICYRIYDKREHLVVGGKKLSTLRNFPHLKSALSAACKINVVTSQLYRFNRRTMLVQNFIDFTVRYALKMIGAGYQRKAIISKIKSYGKHWTPSMGRWTRVLRSILARLQRQNL